MQPKTIELMKIISNWILIIALLTAIIVTLLYKQEVQEAIGGKEPVKLMQLYEERTDTKCLCAMKGYGEVIYVPFKT